MIADRMQPGESLIYRGRPPAPLEWSVTVSRECKWKSSPLLKGDLPRPSIDIVFDRVRNFANGYLHDAFFALAVSDLRSSSKFLPIPWPGTSSTGTIQLAKSPSDVHLAMIN
jgi:hypothetical protein